MCRDLVDALNKMNLVSAAGAARSAIEATCALANADLRSAEAFQPINNVQLRGDAVTRLAEFTERAIWGGRAGLTDVQSINVLSFRDKIVKTTTDEDTKANLARNNEILCDMVHPSALGHQIYWAPEVESPEAGQWLVELRLGEPNRPALSTVPLIAWSLGWSVSWTKRAFDDLAGRAERQRAALLG